MKLQSLINLAQKYLISIGGEERFVREQLDINKFSDSLILVLPDVCVIKPNRLQGGSSNQTHIHCTGNDMLFFYDSTTLRTVTSSTEDEMVKVILIDSNLKHLKSIKNARRDKSKESSFRITGATSIVESSTVKKISKRTNQSPQVQLSKTRMDDIQFIKLRANLFTADRLVFFKYKHEENKYLILGIPSTFNENDDGSNVVVEPEIVEQNLEVEDGMIGHKEAYLREVDVNSIANFAPDDENDDCDDKDSTFDLSKAIKTRKKRTERHSNIVKLVAKVLEDKGFTLFEGRIDCLGIREDSDSIICEVKTLDGSVSDECSQVMKAFSQLFYYEKFHMGKFKVGYTQKIAIFENKISDEHIMFFEENGVLVFWVENGMLNGTEHSLEYLYDLELYKINLSK